MDRSQLVELRNKFARLDDILNSFHREPRPLEDMEPWRERFQALFMQLATINKYPALTRSIAVAPLTLKDLNDIPFYESILRTRPAADTTADEHSLEDAGIRKRAEILLANLSSAAPLKASSAETAESDNAAPPAELIEALKLFY